MRYLCWLPLALLLILSFNRSNAQSVHLSVMDSIKQDKLPFATVHVTFPGAQSKALIYQTDKAGILSFGSEGRALRIVVQYIGFLDQTIDLKAAHADQSVAINMVADVRVLSELQITAKVPLMVQTPSGFTYNVDKTVADINVNTGQLLKKLPGIVAEQDGELRIGGKPITIYLDGKPSLLAGDELRRYLQTLSLQDVKSLKVMTNPPANYDAAGGSIIDIQTNKALLPGIFVRVDGNAGTHDKYGGGLNATYKSKAYTGRYNFNYDHGNLFRNSGYDQINKNAPESLRRYRFDSKVDDNPVNNFNFSMNNDFAINKNHTLGITAKYSHFGTSPTYTNSKLTIWNDADAIQSIQNLSRLDQSGSDIFFADVNYRVLLNAKGSSLTFDTYYWKRKATNDYKIDIDPNGNSVNDLRNHTVQDLSIKSASLSLVHTINPYINFQSGIKVTSFGVDGDIGNELFISNVYVNDPIQSYNLDYTEDVYSGYVSFSGIYKKMQYSVGVRGEGTLLKLHTDRDREATDDKNNFFNLFPVAGIVYPLSSKSSFGLSYSKRIFRVSYSQLNPVDFRSDPSTIQRGNPALKPSKTDNINLSYSYQYNSNHSYTITSSYLSESNPYTWFTLPDSTASTYINEPLNYKNFKYLTLSVNQQHTLSKWFTLSVNLLATRQIYDISDLNLPDPKSVTSYRATVTTGFKYWKNAVVEIFGNVKSKSTTPFGTGASYHYIDLSTTKRFVHDNLSVTLSCNDIFNINKAKYENNSSFFQNSGYVKNETRIGQLSVSYKFGKTNKNTIKDYTPQEDTRFKN